MKALLIKFRPMLAGKLDLKKLHYPALVSPKIDGIRAIVLDGRLVSRTLKPIPNNHIRKFLSHSAYNNFDGELVVGNTFQTTTKGVMSEEGKPSFNYLVFDYVSDGPFEERRTEIDEGELPLHVTLLKQDIVYDEDDLLYYERLYLRRGFEGLMVRAPLGLYKFGRSTVTEGYLLKFKRFADAEGEIVGFEEEMHNANEAMRDELGHTKRSSHQANKVGKNTLGALILKSKEWKVEFCVGSGFTQELRLQIWKNKETYLGQLCKFRYQNFGIKDAPRHAIFVGIRDRRDI